MIELDMCNLTDLQFVMVNDALPFPVRLCTPARKITARSLVKKGWGTVEDGAAGELIFRLNQEGEDEVLFHLETVNGVY